MKNAVKAILCAAVLLSSTALVASNRAGNAEATGARVSEVAPAAVQGSRISGRVVDLATGEALAGVTVRIEGSGQAVFTDFDGRFEFINVDRGSLNLSASFISYQKASVSLNHDRVSQVELSLRSVE